MVVILPLVRTVPWLSLPVVVAAPVAQKPGPARAGPVELVAVPVEMAQMLVQAVLKAGLVVEQGVALEQVLHHQQVTEQVAVLTRAVLVALMIRVIALAAVAAVAVLPAAAVVVLAMVRPELAMPLVGAVAMVLPVPAVLPPMEQGPLPIMMEVSLSAGADLVYQYITGFRAAAVCN